MSWIAGISALALSAKTKLVIAGVFGKIIAGAYLWKTVRQGSASEEKKATTDATSSGETP